MAGINKKTWKTKSGTKSYYEITYYENGKQKHRGGFKTKLDAQIALKETITEKNTEITINKLSQDYLERHCALNCKYSTITLYESYLKSNLQELKPIKAKNLTKRHIENLVLELKRKEISNKTINCIITFLQAMLNYAVEQELIAKNPILRFKKLPQIKPEIHFLNEQQILKFLQLAKKYTPSYYAFFFTAVHTGMRRGELLALEWSDIDFKKQKIRINKQIYRGKTQTTKTGKERYIDISDSLLEILIEHKKKRKVISKYVFHNSEGKPIHPYNMEQRYFKPLIGMLNKEFDEENKIKKLRFHDLRHTYATYLLSKGIPVKYVQEQLGHSTARMTLDTYASVMPSVKFGAIDLLNKLSKNNDKNNKKSQNNRREN